MARVSGPLLSFEASGSVASTLVFSKWKGRPYVRQLVIPSNPQTSAQVAVRAMMKFLSQEWAGLSDPLKASWTALAAQTNVSGFNAYTSFNMSRWTDYNAVVQQYPKQASGTAPTINTFTATGGALAADLAATWTAPGDIWGVILHRSQTTGFTPSRNTAITVLPSDGIAALAFTDGPLTPATYYYRITSNCKSGPLSELSTQKSAVVTA